MHTTRSSTTHVSVASHHMSVMMGVPQVNKFEQLSSLDHRMSVAGWWGPVQRGGGAVPHIEGTLHSKVQCIMGIGHMAHPLNRQTDRQTDMIPNITFLQLPWPIGN